MVEETSDRESELAKVTIGEVQLLTDRIQIVPYDDQWPAMFDCERRRIENAIEANALVIEHVGSTSVPSLAAKPKIDILLVVPDSSNEDGYVPPLEAAGYQLRIREPDWYEHRVLIGTEYPVNCHVFSPGCVEIDRMLGFRDWLRSHQDDRERYQQTKIELAARPWQYMQDYADAKTEVVESILARAMAASGKSNERD